MATISNVNGKKITKIKYKGEIFDTGGGSSSGSTLKTLLDATKSCYYLFYNYKGTSVNDLISYSDTSEVTNMNSMFYQCSKLTTIPQLNTSNVTNMSSMFTSCKKLTTIPLIDTSSVTDMSNMFNNCSSLTTIPQLNTSKVTDISYMFSGCLNLTIIPHLNTSNVTTINNMFSNCNNITTIPQLNTSKVTRVNYMFAYCYKLTTIDITHMNVSSTGDSGGFASNCYSLTKLIIRNMDSIPALNSYAFENCYHFTGTTNSTYNPQGLKDGRIYVPDDKVEALKTATNWSVYADIIVPLSTLVE